MTTIEILDDYIAKFSRWGLWGDNDQLGAMNLVGPEQVRTAAALVRDGRVISLALPFDQNGPQPGGLRSNPRLVSTATGTDHLAGAQGPVVSGFSDDMVIMGTQCGTQWDTLSHIFYRGQMWNGYSAAEHTSIGAARNGIQQWRDRLVLRAVLVDLPTHRGVTSLDPGYAVTVDDLEETLAAQGMREGIKQDMELLEQMPEMEAARGRRCRRSGGATQGSRHHLALALQSWASTLR
jgi:hypothetical protein